MTKQIRVAVTGAAGNIGYSLLFRIASGELFGAETQVHLQLLEIENALKALEGVQMELDDCAFNTLASVKSSSRAEEAFADANWLFLVGSAPRQAGMERKDLLRKNAGIFVEQGQAIEAVAADDARILVVGNPCNTNCLIAKSHAPRIASGQWFAMTALDENRAKSQLAQKAHVAVSEVSNMTIWGNHSATQYPDFYHAQISDKVATDVISDTAWLKNDFISTVQQRGAAIIKARGASSAASAANAALDTAKRILNPTPQNDWFSAGIVSDGSYGIQKGLVFSYPLTSDGSNVSIVQGLEINDFSRQKIDASAQELEQERDDVADLLG